ncbi:MAG: nicotinate-nucleotide adenylyltransferase [Rubricella sp.]
MFQGDPLALPGQRIGLLGGSFDPPHEGHVHISLRALKSIGLDRVWWLVTPGNPLKADAPAELSRRVAAARALVRHPGIVVTDIEARLGTRYTAETLRLLTGRYPQIEFTWLMGADNLATIHHWQDWESIFQRVAVGVLARPGEQIRAGLSPAARRFARARRDPADAKGLGLRGAPDWVLLPGPMRDVSSTSLRGAGLWDRQPSGGEV